MNWLERFQGMWKELLPSEQHALYDVLAMVRGPDNRSYYTEKQQATARFRFVLFGDKHVPGDVNSDGKPLTKEELEDFDPGHYRSHAIDAQIRLVELGVWHTAEWAYG